MIIGNKISPKLIIWLLLIYIGSFHQLLGQAKSISGLETRTREEAFRQDTSRESRYRNAQMGVEPDTNFTWEKYGAFLKKISDTSKYIVLPLNEFRKTINSNKIVIGLRHDVDNDLNVAYQFSETESKLGFRSTYFILHTAPYYLANPVDMSVHTEEILPVLKLMQNIRHFEIGWHNDLVTLQAVYNIDPVSFLHNELSWLRSNGINIYGTASHGSNFCYTYLYLNYYFFNECTYPVVGQFINNLNLTINGKTVPMKKGSLSDFGLEYEAYFLNNNKSFSDATITNGIRWNIGMLDLSQLIPGDRVMILLHPIHWHKGSIDARIESFSIPGQKSSFIDEGGSSVTVDMPYKTNLTSLAAFYTLSPGAYIKVGGKMQFNGTSLNNFTNPVPFVVFAENRDFQRIWTINVKCAKNDSADFRSFSLPGLSKFVSIDPVQKTILLKVNAGTDLSGLKVSFRLSEGATAWINNTEQFSNVGTMNFTQPVEYVVKAENGTSSSRWRVTVQALKSEANFVSFAIPGQIGPALIDTLNNSVIIYVGKEFPVNEIIPLFEASGGARVWIGKQEQLSGLNTIDFSTNVEYVIVSATGDVIKTWKVTILQKSTGIEDNYPGEELKVYPNPTSGKVTLVFKNIRTFPTQLGIFNLAGNKVYSDLISKTGDFNYEVNLTVLPSGIYIVKYSGNRKPLMIILTDH